MHFRERQCRREQRLIAITHGDPREVFRLLESGLQSSGNAPAGTEPTIPLNQADFERMMSKGGRGT